MEGIASFPISGTYHGMARVGGILSETKLFAGAEFQCSEDNSRGLDALAMAIIPRS